MKEKKRISKFKIILFLIVVLLVSGVFARNAVVKATLSAGVKAITGLDLSIKSIKVGLATSLIDIKDLKLHNPPEFSDEIMVYMPKIYIDYRLRGLLKKKVHFNKITLNLKEILVVKNKDGQLNLDKLKAIQSKQEKEPVIKKASSSKMPQLQIDNLDLKIGKVIYKDYSLGETPKVREYDINIDEQYTNISDPKILASLIVSRALMHTTISSLTNFDLKSVNQGLSETLKGVGSQTTEAAKKTLDTAVDAIKNILPFGK